jgi:hypothetical protein
MTQADVKAEGQHFRMFAGMQQGELIAHVYDYLRSARHSPIPRLVLTE